MRVIEYLSVHRNIQSMLDANSIRFQLFLTAIILSSSSIAQTGFTDSFNQIKNGTRLDLRKEISDEMGNTTHIPISIIKGNNEGPVFTIVGGVHGFEYPPIVAVQSMMKEIDPTQVSGTLIVIPIANISSFFGRSPFVNPQDDINLNRTFPGKSTGSVTERIARFMTDSIISVTDVFLDIHGGDAGEDLLPFVCYYNNKDRPEQTALAKKLSEVSGFNYIVSYGYNLKEDEPAKYAFKQAVQDGKTGLSIEAGKLGNVQEEAVTSIRIGIFNMLMEMDMYPGKPEIVENPIRLSQQVYLRSEHQGIFFSEKKSGDLIKPGEIVGTIEDEFGKVLLELNAPHGGIILYKIGTPPVNVGETIMCISY